MGNVRTLRGSVACFAILSCTSKSPPLEAAQGAAAVSPDPAVPAVVSAPVVSPDPPPPAPATATAAVPVASASAAAEALAGIQDCSRTRRGCMREDRPKKNRVQQAPKPTAP